MRQLILGVIAAVALGGTAAAQYGTTPYQSGFTTSVSPLGRLSPETLQWMMAEAMRQAQAPTALTELDIRIEKAAGEELAAGRERLSKADLVSAMRFEIVREAQDMMKREVRERKKTANSDTSDEAMLSLQAAISRQNRLKALVDQAKVRLTAKAKGIVEN